MNKYSRNSNIVKYYYYLKLPFYIFMYFELTYSCDGRVNFQCHVILQKSF